MQSYFTVLLKLYILCHTSSKCRLKISNNEKTCIFVYTQNTFFSLLLSLWHFVTQYWLPTFTTYSLILFARFLKFGERFFTTVDFISGPLQTPTLAPNSHLHHQLGNYACTLRSGKLLRMLCGVLGDYVQVSMTGQANYVSFADGTLGAPWVVCC